MASGAKPCFFNCLRINLSAAFSFRMSEPGHPALRLHHRQHATDTPACRRWKRLCCKIRLAAELSAGREVGLRHERLQGISLPKWRPLKSLIPQSLAPAYAASSPPLRRTSQQSRIEASQIGIDAFLHGFDAVVELSAPMTRKCSAGEW